MASSLSRSPQKPPLAMEADPDTDGLKHRSPSRSVQPDDTRFPQGQCRYILMVPELKGQRCGCVTFSHNKAMPGATCDCGHLACFHLASPETFSPSQSRMEIEQLKQRLLALEQQAQPTAEHRSKASVLHRLSQMEEALDKYQEETRSDTKGTYKHISAAWQLGEQLQQRLSRFEDNDRIQSEQLQRVGKELEDLRNRNLELLEAEEMLEERVEKLESAETAISSETALMSTPYLNSRRRRRSSSHRSVSPLGNDGTARHEDIAIHPATPSGPWTIHVSLLPSRKQQLPFVKDSSAYKRCLSRGLQRMVAVEGLDAVSFGSAINRAFRDVLRNQPWEPLQVKDHDSAKLGGPPTLQPLDRHLIHREVNAQFISRYCAVGDADGRPESMYIATSCGSLSWSDIRERPMYVEGLESSWAYDWHLDGAELDDDVSPLRQSATDHLPLLDSPSLQSLKRDVAEMQAGNLTGTLRLKGETDSHRTKMARTCLSERFEIRREVEAAL